MVQELARGSMAKIKSDGEGEVVQLVRDEEEDDVVLPGFRFHPTDEELVTFYLRRKVAKKKLSIEIIKEMDIYKHDPWDIAKASTVGEEKEWYFFCLRGRKYRNSIRPNRVTGSGFWKATGIDRPIYPAANSGEAVGLKKSLVYYRGSAGKGTKTDWMMHEFRLPPTATTNAADASSSPSMQEAEVWTICRIFKRNVTYKKQPGAALHWKEDAGRKATAPDSSSNTGSFESDTGDEYVDCFLTPVIPQPHGGQMNVASGYFSKQSCNQFQGQWSTVPVPLSGQKPQAPSMVAFHQNDLSLSDWDELGRMMELTDPSAIL